MKLLSLVLVLVISVCFSFAQNFPRRERTDQSVPYAEESQAREAELEARPERPPISSSDTSPAEKLALEKQKKELKRADDERAGKENVIRKSRTDRENAVIDSNKKLFNGFAAGNKNKAPYSSDKAILNIDNVEKLKMNIEKFKRYYDSDSDEIKSLMLSLNDFYDELESVTYETTTYSGELILRAGEYDKKTETWTVNVLSEIANRAGLFSYSVQLSYRDLVKKNGIFQGSSSFDDEEKINIMIVDSLFRQTVPLVSAKLEYKIYHWEGPSEYRFVPTKLTLYRADKTKPIYTADSAQLSHSFFTTHPAIEVRTRTVRSEEKEKTVKSIAKEEKREPFYKNALTEQKERRSIYFSCDTLIPTEGEYNFREDINLNTVSLTIDWGINDIFYLGGGFDWINKGKNQSSAYAIFVNTGINATFYGLFRPYIGVTAGFNTDIDGSLTADIGLDILIRKMLLNVYYGHNWEYDFNDSRKKGLKKMDTYHTVGVGFGITW